MKCKCGCGQEVPKAKGKTPMYLNMDHYLRDHILHPRKRTGNYGKNHLTKAGFFEKHVRTYLEEKNYPTYISRGDITDEISNNVNLDKKEIKQCVTAIMPVFGYKRRNRHTYEKVE